MLSIGSFSKMANISTKALRYYDEIGLLKPRHVDSATGYRYYDAAQLKSMLLIGRLKAYGFTLEEIAGVMQSPEDSTLLLPAITRKKQELEGVVAAYTDVVRQMARDIASLEGGQTLMSYLDTIQVELTQTQPMQVAYSRGTMNVHEYNACVGRLMERVAAEKLTPTGPPMCVFHSTEFDPEHCDMEAAIPVAAAAPGTREFPGQLCVHATLKGAYTGLTSAYAKMREWMEAEGYSFVGPSFEIYATDPATTLPEENITEIYFPVKKNS